MADALRTTNVLFCIICCICTIFDFSHGLKDAALYETLSHSGQTNDKSLFWTFHNTDETSAVFARHKRQVLADSDVPSTTPMISSIIEDDHDYYSTSTYRDLSGMHFYVEPSEFNAAERHPVLSDTHLVAEPRSLSFVFPFYGHDISQLYVTTGGFLYLSSYFEPAIITQTHYVAPLMASFDLSLGNNSHLFWVDTGSRFIVWWENVLLHDDPAAGEFTFQVQLYDTGKIVFAYKQIPTGVHLLNDTEHRVIVGLADAFYIDRRVSPTLIERLIYNYHRVNINPIHVETHGAVVIEPKTLCHDLVGCNACVTRVIGFNCTWCEAMQRCSSGVDRLTQQFIDSGCSREAGVRSAEQCPSGTTSPSTTESTMTADARKGGGGGGGGSSAGVTAAVVLVTLLLVAIIAGVIGWVVYAYRNPNTQSGRWLIEHRPSQLREQLGKVRFWKKNSSSGDKYSVDVGTSVA